MIPQSLEIVLGNCAIFPVRSEENKAFSSQGCQSSISPESSEDAPQNNHYSPAQCHAVLMQPPDFQKHSSQFLGNCIWGFLLFMHHFPPSLCSGFTSDDGTSVQIMLTLFEEFEEFLHPTRLHLNVSHVSLFPQAQK